MKYVQGKDRKQIEFETRCMDDTVDADNEIHDCYHLRKALSREVKDFTWISTLIQNFITILMRSRSGSNKRFNYGLVLPDAKWFDDVGYVKSEINHSKYHW